MENNMKELNLKEMEKAAGGLRTEMLTPEERAAYLDMMKRKWDCVYADEWDRLEAMIEEFKRQMVIKYGKEVTSDEHVRYIG
ncbi:MAG: hypothetical protein IK127_05190 [Clostridia bacterium]|nr:hypothetical protein [Clostridia bacterium]